MADRISRDYAGREPVAVAVLKGAAVFHADLIRHLSIGVTVDFISLASYHDATSSSGEVQLLKSFESDLSGAEILLVEDIVDTGRTMERLIAETLKYEPRSIRICSLLSKSSRREVDIPIDYLGFEIPDRFVVGFGLDYAEKYRNLPFIGILPETD